MPPRKTAASKPAEPEVAEAAVADPPADATPETSAYTVTVLDFAALILAIVTAAWAVMDRTWQLLIVSIAVILLALSPALNVHIH
jgi:hypothetical protein